jgi:hypothetical protein
LCTTVFTLVNISTRLWIRFAVRKIAERKGKRSCGHEVTTPAKKRRKRGNTSGSLRE